VNKGIGRRQQTKANVVPRFGEMSRRDFLKASGVLIVAFSAVGPLDFSGVAAAAAQESIGVPADWLDSWLAIAEDGSVTLFTGKVDLGTGVETAMAQIAAEELDVAFDRVTVVQGDTALTVDQGATTGSQSIARGGPQVRQAAAEARLALLEMAAVRLDAPVEALNTREGVVSVRATPARSVTYGELVRGGRFELRMAGAAQPKTPDAYHIVGQSIHRVDIPSKVTGQAVYVQDVRLPGMLHGRLVMPSGIGSSLLEVDESSVSDIPGAQVIVRRNFVGVVAPREEHAIRAAQQLRVTWSSWEGLPGMDDLYSELRRTPARDEIIAEVGDVQASLRRAAKALEATYLFPFQTHGSIGPSCAVADVKDSQATVWSPTQGSHGMRTVVAAALGLPAENVRVIWVQGSGSYGPIAGNDVTVDAALMSQAVGRPVRVQWTRQEEHRWGTAGPAMVMDLRGGVDADGRIAAWEYEVFSPSHFYNDRLAEQLVAGLPLVPEGPPSRPTPWGGEPRIPYAMDGAVRAVLHQLQATPLRSQPLRAPGQVGTTFAHESFIDELAAAAGVDPIEFRLRHLKDARAVAVLTAVAERAGWDARPSPRHDTGGASPADGRGIALVQRSGTYVAMVIEVAVDAQNGGVRLKRAVVAHDCGLIINPDGVVNQVEGNVIQAASRVLKEEARFDRSNVTTVDWASYPILTFAEVPEIEVVLIDRPDVAASGSGEAASCPVGAAISNAIFDATGARLRQVPFTPERVMASILASRHERRTTRVSS
jgi:CO/xanthine dehydrogenase Mo-binding subunit